MAPINDHLVKWRQTWDQYADQQMSNAQDKENLINKTAEEKAKIIQEKNDYKRWLIDKREDQMQENFSEFKDKSEKRYWESDKIVSTQENIAARDANIAVAQAAKNWYGLSESEKRGITEDVTNVYGKNIATAQQNNLNTKMNLDEAIKNSGIQQFQSQWEIDNLKSMLKDEDVAPFLAALDEAKAGNKEALDSINSYYSEWLRLLGTEKIARAAKTERIQDYEDEFQNSDFNKKASTIRDYVDGIPWGKSISSTHIEETLKKYPNMNYSQIIGQLSEEANYISQNEIRLQTIAQKDPKIWTADERALYEQAISRWLTASDRAYNNASTNDKIVTGNTDENITQHLRSDTGRDPTPEEIKARQWAQPENAYVKEQRKLYEETKAKLDKIAKNKDQFLQQVNSLSPEKQQQVKTDLKKLKEQNTKAARIVSNFR